MKSASPALIALLNSSQQFSMADCFTFTLASGTILRYTSWGAPVVYGGETFAATGPLLERSRTRCVLGVEVDRLDLTIYPAPTDTIAGLTWTQAAVAGGFDGARMRLDRVFFDEALAVVGGYLEYEGELGELTVQRTQIEGSVTSDLYRLNVQFPRNLYQPSCMHTVYDPRCGLNRESWKVASTVTSGATRTQIPCGLAQAAAYFDLGYIRFTSGDLAGTRRTVKAYVPGMLTLLNPLPVAPDASDAFDAYPGCNRLQATCSGKFGNLPNFKATPYIPVPETAL